jgi:hypothetical protein
MGEVSTNLISPDSISFGPESIYTAALEGIREWSRNHARNSMKPEVFAKQVVQAILILSGPKEILSGEMRLVETSPINRVTTLIPSGLSISPDSISFGPESIYTAALEGIREWSRNHARNSMKKRYCREK